MGVLVRPEVYILPSFSGGKLAVAGGCMYKFVVVLLWSRWSTLRSTVHVPRRLCMYSGVRCKRTYSVQYGVLISGYLTPYTHPLSTRPGDPIADHVHGLSHCGIVDDHGNSCGLTEYCDDTCGFLRNSGFLVLLSLHTA